MRLELATIRLAQELEEKADNYGGDPLTQSLLNYFKKYALSMVEQERENIMTAFDDGVQLGMNTYKQPIKPPAVYLREKFDID